MIELHPGQSQVYDDLFVSRTCRFSVAVCSRGWGKSYIAAATAVTAVFELLELDYLVPNKIVNIIAPTYAQVTDIYYPLLAYEMGMDAYARKSSKDLGRFWFPSNVELRLVSFEAVERLRGTGSYFTVCDEVEDWSKGPGLAEAWQSIIKPTITTRWSPKRALALGAKSPGRALIIGTPKGYTTFYDMYNYREKDPLWKSYHFDYTTSPFLDPKEVENEKHTMDPLRFAREYDASFQDSGNSVFYMFNRKTNVRNDLSEFEDDEDVHVCIDFNVGIQASSAFALRGQQQHFLDEFKGHPDTEQLADAIIARYRPADRPAGKRKIYVYPDPTGKARKTSAPVGVTDFTILQSRGLIVRSRDKSPPIADSVNAVNARLKNAAGISNMFFHPRCAGAIQSMERTHWLENNPDSMTLDKKEGLEHYSDGIRYGTEFLFPIKRSVAGSKRGFRF
jgi:hypothetical protein